MCALDHDDVLVYRGEDRFWDPGERLRQHGFEPSHVTLVERRERRAGSDDAGARHLGDQLVDERIERALLQRAHRVVR